MGKQENYNFNIKHNKISLFLTRFLFGNNMDYLRKSGYIDSFIKDKNINEELLNLKDEDRSLFLLFKNNKLKIDDIIEIIRNISHTYLDIRYFYELIDNYVMIVIDYPSKYIKDYDNIINGKYSKLSEKFKNTFPETEDVLNEKKIRIGKRHTIYYHIFNKTEWLQNYWKTKLNLIELDDNLELWTKPLEEDLVFNIKNYIKN